MKSEYGTKLERLEAKMAGVGQSPTNIDRLIEQGVGNLFRIADVYADGSPAQKKLVIGSMFPEKMTFDGFLLRTGRVNEVAQIIYKLGAGLGENKTGQRSDETLLS